MSKIPQKVEIYFQNQLAGTLSQTDDNMLEFDYSPNYKGFSVSPELPLSQKTHQSYALWNCFLDASPDRYGKTMIDAEYGVKSFSDYEYFVLTSDFDRQGSIRVSYKGEFIMPTSKFRSVSHFSNVFSGVSEQAIEDNFKLTTTNGTSTGGSQPKLSAYDKDGNLFMIKTTYYDPRSNVAFETTALDLAKLCEIDTEEYHFVKKGNSFPDTLIVKRFDRIKDQRIPYISARTLLNGLENNYVNFAKFLDKNDKLELFKRAILNVLINNDDDHNQNHGLLMNKNGEWKLSPCFDLMPYKLIAPGFTISSIQTNDRSVSKLIKEFESFDLTKIEAEKIVFNIQDTVKKNWLKTAIQYMTKEEALLRADCFRNN
jgi:serine/threonine-protein kinase HipA